MAGWMELSPRQREVAELAAQNRTYDEIGALLGISPRTAKHHVQEALRRLGLPRKRDLARAYNERT